MASRSLFSTQLFKDHPDAIAAAICAICVLLGWLMLQFNWVGLSILILSAAYVIGGYESAKEGLTTLFEEKEFDVDLLMIVAALGAAGLGLWQQDYHLAVDGAVLILIFAISGALEGYAMKHTQRNIRSLMAMTPDTATLIRGGIERVIPIERLQIGDRVIVKPGELIPTDAIIVEGCSAINQASITGESIPVEKMPPDEVFGGTINGSGALQLQVHKPPESSLIGRVIQLVQQAQTEAPPSQLFIERFERGYAKIIIIVGILLAIAPPFLLGWSWEDTIYRALIFLVVASPCALMASIMPALLSGIANGARKGILFKTGAQLELMGKVRAIAFDKTGTLTTGQLEVAEILPALGYTQTKVLAIAAALETFSEHPMAEAIVQAAKQQKLTLFAAQDVKATAGQGISGIVEGEWATVGKISFIETIFSQSILDPSLHQRAQALEAEGNSVIWVGYAGKVLGAIAVSDTIRPTAAATIKRLKQLGIEQIVMVTGDNQRCSDRVASQLGVDRVYAELLPEDKVSIVQHLQKDYKTVAMVGDGINDAPALAMASVGIAMGAAGTDIALETADIVLMADRLEKLEVAIRLGRRSQRIVTQNIIFALSFIVLLLIANFMGNITMPLGVIGHEGSTVLVTLSGLRLLRG
jgi:Zn2+/Cd2+-exporting ATPase